jgi:L-alanine-DL-glutamate epimerase-like enolase superfamily enzyme
MGMSRPQVAIEKLGARAYRIPTDAPEADGTFAWDSTTMIIVEVEAGGVTGLGYTYGAAAIAPFIEDALAPVVMPRDAMETAFIWRAMIDKVRNIGRPGLASCAIAAVDVALWDLKARLLGLPLADLFGGSSRPVAIYGSGGFTTYSDERLAEQIAHFVSDLGCAEAKIKIGETPERDLARAEFAARAMDGARLMVDANGAYSVKQALGLGQRLADIGVSWFEEPVSSDDLPGLRLVRERLPAPIEVAAGEYAFDQYYAAAMVGAGAVDVLQLDATRCCGYTGFLRGAAVAEASHIDISAHTAPALHLALCCATPDTRHIEWFHDHARIEAMFFDGAPRPSRGAIAPDLSQPGHGLVFKREDAERFAL